MYNILTLNNISPVGLDKFDKKRFKVSDKSKDPDAILVRSCNMHSLAIDASVKVIGRAGAGTNNIPVEQMTVRGIPVMNTPGANANAVKELVITGLLLACRNICPAWDYAKHIEGDNKSVNEQVEKNKKRFAGIELTGRTLGVIGLGHIGVKVANAARYLGMNVIGYDPAVTVENAWEMRSSVQQAEKIDDVFASSDFITVHVPLNDKTSDLIASKQIKKMKDGVVLMNFARDGIINNADLLAALGKKVRSYVCDFPSTDFMQHPNVICLPHLGASTQEAEENCAKMIVEQVSDFLIDGTIKNSVNFPSVKLTRSEDGYRVAIVNKNIPNMVAQISTALSKASINIIDMINKSRQEIAYTLLDVNTELDNTTLQALKAIDGVIDVRVC